METKFTKEQILGSEKYAVYRDLLQAVLEEVKTYDQQEIMELVNNFMKRKGE